MIRVLLADDEDLIRVAVAALLELETDVEVVAQAADGTTAVAKLGATNRAEAFRIAHDHGWL